MSIISHNRISNRDLVDQDHDHNGNCDQASQDPYHDLNGMRDQDRDQRPVAHDRDQESRS